MTWVLIIAALIGLAVWYAVEGLVAIVIRMDRHHKDL